MEFGIKAYEIKFELKGNDKTQAYVEILTIYQFDYLVS